MKVLKPFQYNLCIVTGHIVPLKDATAIIEEDRYEGVYLVFNYVEVVGTLQVPST